MRTRPRRTVISWFCLQSNSTLERVYISAGGQGKLPSLVVATTGGEYDAKVARKRSSKRCARGLMCPPMTRMHRFKSPRATKRALRSRLFSSIVLEVCRRVSRCIYTYTGNPPKHSLYCTSKGMTLRPVNGLMLSQVDAGQIK